ETVTKQGESTRHCADLVRTRRRDWHRQVAGAQAVNGTDQAMKGHCDRSQNSKRQQDTQGEDQKVGYQRAPCCGGDVIDDLVPLGGKLRSQFADKGIQQLVDFDTVVASQREQRIADDTLVVGIFVDGVVRRFIEFVALGSNDGDELGLAHCELVK